MTDQLADSDGSLNIYCPDDTCPPERDWIVMDLEPGVILPLGSVCLIAGIAFLVKYRHKGNLMYEKNGISLSMLMLGLSILLRAAVGLKTDHKEALYVASMVLDFHAGQLKVLRQQATEQEAQFVKEFKLTETPCVCIFHSNGNVMLSGDSLNRTQLFAKLVPRVHGHGSNDAEDTEYTEIFERNSWLHEQRQEALKKLYIAENGEQETEDRNIYAAEAEKYRKMIVKERCEVRKQLIKLRSDIQDDREAYKFVHGETKIVTAVDKCEVIGTSAKTEENKARLLFRLSNGETKEESFGKEAKFAHVREYIESTMGVVKNRSEVVSMRPWRVFDASVDGLTLQELGLAPSATLNVR
ncbi:hypothetical protein EV175_000951, partial [Coemansia sp. RSA 1933]